MNAVEKFYQIHNCIEACKTLPALEICEEMINHLSNYGFAQTLADQALQKRIELLTTRYVETE